ncbi:MAG: efflux RND transporter periplasmic adaptor subunit, partial [Anaerolineae bacterium]|nr:efflux RND transporter periplasmic adaptor subunit [Anaerolineae bacterium]
LNQRRAEIHREIAQLQLEAAKNAENPDATSISILEKEVELAQIALDEVLLGVERRDEEIAKAQITAPFSGQLLSVGLNEGQTVSAFSGGLVLADVSNLEIAASLQSTQVEELSTDMVVKVTALNRPGEVMEGTIRYLPYQGDSADTGDGFVRITLGQTPQESGLELGDRVQVTIPLESKLDVLWLPPQAIRQFEGRRFVVVRDGEVEQRVDVRVGLQTEDRVEITEGLTEGQVVVGA